MYKAIFFDVGEVVVYEDFLGFFEKIEKEHNLPPKTLYMTILHIGAWDEYNKGKISQEKLIEDILHTKYIEPDIIAKVKRWREDILSPMKDVVQLVKKLKRNYKVYALSNVDKDTVKYIEDKWKLYDIFDGRILSCEVGMIKPDKDIFDYALKLAGVKKEEALFIDNYGKNTRAATALGIKSIKFRTYEQLVKDLNSMGIKF